MAYASPTTYIERDNVLYPNIHHHRDTNIHTNKMTATNKVFNLPRHNVQIQQQQIYSFQNTSTLIREGD